MNPSVRSVTFGPFSKWTLSGERVVIHYRILFLPCNVTFINLVCREINSFLVDLFASATQLYHVFVSDALNFFVFGTTVFRMLALDNSLLHGIAAAIGVSDFCLAFWMMSL